VRLSSGAVLLGASLARLRSTGIPEDAIGRPPSKREVIQQMRSHYIAALVGSDMVTMKVLTD
jgi:hypothetical protein